MTELAGAELVVVQGFVIGEVGGGAIMMRDPDPDAEPEDLVVAPVVSKPVALAGQKALPMLRSLAAHTFVQAQPRATLPDVSTGYFALLTVASNDPDVDVYGGREITLPDGTSKVVQVPYNAPLTSVTAPMAAQTGLTQGSQVRAFWFTDAAEYEPPEPTGPAYYTADQVDSLLDGISAPAWASVTGKPTFAQVATSGVYGDLAGRPDLSTLATSAAVPELARDAVGLALANGQHTGISFVADDDNDRINATVTVSGGGGGGGSTLTQTATKTGAYTAQPGEAVPLSTTGGAFTLTLPSGAALGAQVAARWTAGTAAPTIAAPSGETINGAATTTLTLAPGSSSGEFIAWQKWTSTVWLPVGGFKPQTALDARNDARYLPVETATSAAFRAHLATTQTVANNDVNVLVAFPTVTRASSLVTPSTSGTGHKFTLGRAGVWVGSVTVRLPAASAGEAYVAVLQSGSPGSGIVNALGSAFGGATATRCLPISGYFDVGTAISVTIYQNSGASQGIDHGSGNWCHIDLNWVHG